MRAPAWRWGLANRRPHPFKRGAHTLVPTGRFVAGQLVGLGDGGGDQAQGGDAGAGIGPDGQVAGHRQWIGRQGAQVHRRRTSR